MNFVKKIFLILALLLLAPWPVAYAYTYANDAVGQGPARIEVVEASVATNTVTGYVITAPETVLPGHVYVLNNREIVIEETWCEMKKSRDTVEEPSSHSETTSHCATIKASVTVTPTRLIVVNENDRIVEIWSNTTGTKRDFYSLRVKEQSLQGVEHPLTQEILAQYNRLLGEVDWTETGQVYSNTTADYTSAEGDSLPPRFCVKVG